MSADDVEGRILAFIHGELVSSGVTIKERDELLTGEVLDSIGIVRLATFVQEEFQFKMQPADFVIENFQSVSVLADYVRKGITDEP